MLVTSQVTSRSDLEPHSKVKLALKNGDELMIMHYPVRTYCELKERKKDLFAFSLICAPSTSIRRAN